MPKRFTNHVQNLRHASAWVALVIPTPLVCSYAFANENRLIEEVIVMAQRVEENAQEVPMSLSAFTDAMIEDRQIIGILGLQMNAPNVSATDANFGDRQLAIRGVGNLIEVQGRSQPSVSYHLNQIPFDPPLTEFYDLERLEVLRGPQGTLYGRNSTAGAVNAITRRPSFEGTRGELGFEVGNYDLIRAKGAAEASFSDSFAVRVAGYKLDRDGYIDNLADGQVPNVDGDLDGRDVYSFRITPEWRISDRSTLWLMYEKTKEDDDRVRISNQICKTNPLPTYSCVPDEFGLEAPNPSARIISFFSGLSGLYPLGARDESSGLQFDYPRPELGIRDQHTDLEPIFEYNSDIWMAGFEHEFDHFAVSVLGSYQESKYLSLQDFYMDVGHTLQPNLNNLSGQWPTSQANRSASDPFGGPCPILSGAGGIWGGCVVETDQTRFFSYDQVANNKEAWTAEAKLASDLQGSINFILGGQYIKNKNVSGSYVVGNNEIDALLSSVRLYSSMDFFATQGDLESYSFFGEIYWKPTDYVKVTAGLRYSNDTSRSDGVSGLGQSFGLPTDTSNPPGWIRQPLGSWLSPSGPDETARALTDYYGATARAEAAVDTGNFPELLATLQSVPPIPTFGEAAAVLGTPDRLGTDDTTGRLGIDWQIRNDLMLYIFYSRGASPGGYTLDQRAQAAGRFDGEKVDAFEIGAKSMLLDGSLLLNVAAFFNAHDGLQVSSRPPGPVPVEILNMDADAWGMELEGRWRPTSNLDVEFAYGWLDTKIDDFASLDILNLTQGNPNLVLLDDTSLVPGATGSNYVAPRAEVLAITGQAIGDGAALPIPGTVHADGIPVWFDRNYLEINGVATSDGVPADLDGNQLPTAPKHSIHLGLAYTWFWQAGSLTARWDYYWQDKSYARVFNALGDKIDSWDQHNASLVFTSAGGRWRAKAWIRNIGDEDNVTDHYLHATEGTGPYRNYFLTEPRVYGATFSYSFGEQ